MPASWSRPPCLPRRFYDATAKATNVFGHDIEYVMDEGGPPADKELGRFPGLFRSKQPHHEAAEHQRFGGSGFHDDETAMWSREKALASTEGSRVGELLSRTPPLPNEKIVEELFLATLSRYPTGQEMATGVSHIAAHRDKGVEDLQWALLNKLEFIVNY